MEIGKKLKEARNSCQLTQEEVADKLQVSRQTISNWENERSYPDIVSVIRLSDLYSLSLDELLKGDKNLIEHLKESTNTVASNKKLITAILMNIFMLILMVSCYEILPENRYFMIGVFSLSVVSLSFLMYQIIKKL